MTLWGRRIRGALGMGVAWALIWAAFGLLVGAASNVLPFLPWRYFFDIWDAPLPALGMPGFIGGIFFSIILGRAAARSRFEDLSIPRVAAWGAAGGLLLSLVPAAMVGVGMAHMREGLGIWRLTSIIAPPLMILSSVSAAASLFIAGFGRNRQAGEAPDDAQVAQLTERELEEIRVASRSRTPR